ncbi:hypothetical protein FUAX_03250 [Fulvitalea axinellae]|uniref:Uncharacterized protein n=1 Tax=Fulvitalea axinellae TaxID=1182444 RepID=A0AAU9CIT5_9BACT|nr:hypothetical protein FUAX_03250 [Fulvitalea axinellae]
MKNRKVELALRSVSGFALAVIGVNASIRFFSEMESDRFAIVLAILALGSASLLFLNRKKRLASVAGFLALGGELFFGDGVSLPVLVFLLFALAYVFREKTSRKPSANGRRISG